MRGPSGSVAARDVYSGSRIRIKEFKYFNPKNSSKSKLSEI